MRCYESSGSMIVYYYPILIERITACWPQYQLTYWHCFLCSNVLPDPNGTRTIYFGDVNCKRLIPLPVATFGCHIHCKRVQICTNPISWYFPLKSRFLIKSIAGGYSYAEGTAADFEATWTPLWSGKWRLHRTARAGKIWFLFFKLSRHADLESHLSSFCWFSGYPCVCDCVGLCVGCQDSIGGTLTGQSRSSWVRDSDVKGDQDNKWCRSKQAKINYSKERFEDGLRWRSTAKQ